MWSLLCTDRKMNGGANKCSPLNYQRDVGHTWSGSFGAAGKTSSRTSGRGCALREQGWDELRHKRADPKGRN